MTGSSPDGLWCCSFRFIEDVGAFLGANTVDVVLTDFQDRLRKFKLIEGQLIRRKAQLMGKLPEIQKALDIVNKLIELSGSGGEMITDFELADGVFAKTRVQGVKTVNLWLGAGVMVEYPLEEAQEVLSNNLKVCKANLSTVNSDLEVRAICLIKLITS